MLLIIYHKYKIFIIISDDGCKKVTAPEYCCIAALRGLELKKNNPSMWNRLQLLMDHDEDRKLETEYQDMFQVPLVKFRHSSQNIFHIAYSRAASQKKFSDGSYCLAQNKFL